MIVSTESHPNILQAIHVIQMETGDHLAIPVHTVPDRWKNFIPSIEKTISTLSRKTRAPEEEPLPPHVKPSELLDSEFYSFCNGTYEVQQAMAQRDPGSLAAHVFLTDLFENWTYTEDNGSRVPSNVIRQMRIEYLEMVERESGLGLSIAQMRELEELRLQLT